MSLFKAPILFFYLLFISSFFNRKPCENTTRGRFCKVNLCIDRIIDDKTDIAQWRELFENLGDNASSIIDRRFTFLSTMMVNLFADFASGKIGFKQMRETFDRQAACYFDQSRNLVVKIRLLEHFFSSSIRHCQLDVKLENYLQFLLGVQNFLSVKRQLEALKSRANYFCMSLGAIFNKEIGLRRYDSKKAMSWMFSRSYRRSGLKKKDLDLEAFLDEKKSSHGSAIVGLAERFFTQAANGIRSGDKIALETINNQALKKDLFFNLAYYLIFSAVKELLNFDFDKEIETGPLELVFSFFESVPSKSIKIFDGVTKRVFDCTRVDEILLTKDVVEIYQGLRDGPIVPEILRLKQQLPELEPC